MAANGIRPINKSPPFLAIGLFVALVILAFNYWNLSAKNGEQANEIALMESELRLVNAKKVSAEKRSEAVTDKVKDLEDQMQKQKDMIAHNAAELGSIQQEKTKLQTSIKDLEQSLAEYKETHLPQCQTEKGNLQEEINKKTEEVNNLMKALNEKKCGEEECKSFAVQARDAAIQDVYNAAGPQPLIQLLKKDGNLGSFRDSIKQMMEQQEAMNILPGQVAQGDQQQDQNNPLVPEGDKASQQGEANPAKPGETNPQQPGETNPQQPGETNPADQPTVDETKGDQGLDVGEKKNEAGDNIEDKDYDDEEDTQIPNTDFNKPDENEIEREDRLVDEMQQQ